MTKRIVLISATLAVLLIAILLIETSATNSGSSENASLTIRDDTDSGERYAYCSVYCSQKDKPSSSLWNTYFNANYTNSTSSTINSSNGNCTIRFNETGTWTNWENAVYNSSSLLWDKNRSFVYKGNLSFGVNCTSIFGNITLSDSIEITNTEPYIIKTPAGYIDFDGNGIKDTLQCTEDTLCYYNFSANVSEDDLNDVLTFNYSSTANTTLTNFTINSLGMLEINITYDGATGNKKAELTVKDTESTTKAGILEVNITAVNDAPVFAGLQNETFNQSSLFERIINVTDEENNAPFVLNIDFLNCSVAEWSTRNCSNSTGRELFNSSQYSFNSVTGILNISFTPLRNDVGSYIINFSVMDNSSLGNKTTSQIINFSVLNINEAPYFRYICTNERNATEDSEFVCWINATDTDETGSLNFSANYSWFKFNGTINSIAIGCNISTNYNASALVNFTPADAEVGNWSINISVRDTGSPQKINSTTFWFFINNTEDLPTLKEIANQTVYQNKTIYANATDDDLLVSQKNIKNETLTFSSNTSWVSVSTFLAPSGVNYTTARISIDYDYALSSLGAGNHTAKINVTDGSGNKAERNFTIQILGDDAPVWNETMASVFIIYENNNTYLNFSENVTDADGDSITFSFVNYSAFPSFNISTQGIINFTAKDGDVGYHNITINASDGKLASANSFNFTIYNINDAVFLGTSILADNASVSGLQVAAQEDNYTKLYLYAYDDDFKIPSGQKGFYNETLNMTTSILGANTTLFRFSIVSSPIEDSGSNLSIFEAVFTPRKSDIGSYNITINVTDLSNSSSSMQFNLTINEISHPPSLMTLANQTSAVNRNLYYRINATDTEDGSSNATGNTNLTFTYNFTSGRNIFNSSIFNSTSGEINITFNSSQGGKYRINVSVNDTDGELSSAEFWLFVYDYPSIIAPATSYEFSLTENTTSSLNFTLNHSVGDNLTCLFYIYSSNSSALRYNSSYYGNGTNLTWQFTPNFTDETYGFANLTLIVYPTADNLANKNNLSSTRNWSINIGHKNSLLSFSGNIGGSDSLISGVSPQEVSLLDYFLDIDASDYNHNQTIGFVHTLLNSSGGAISVSITNWTNGTTPKIIFSASTTGTSNYSLIAYEYNISNVSQIENNVSSNNFSVTLTITTTPEESSGGGGGGGGATKTTLLKIILPDPLSVYKKDRIVIPITLINQGTLDLNDINLTSIIAKNGTIRKDINLSFDKDYFKTLKAGATENVTLTVTTNTQELGMYEITLNASVKNPKYDDWGKFYLTVKEANKTEVLESIVFTEEFIAENPECLEIKELIKEAKKYYDAGEYQKALEKSKEAIEACKNSISQSGLPRKKEKLENNLYKYLSFSFLIAIAVGIVYYIYKRHRLKKIY